MDKKNSSDIAWYDPVKDIKSVDQFGFVNLRDAFINGSIPGDVSFSEEHFNGVEDPSSLLGKSSDVFDAYRKASYVKSAEQAVAAQAAAASSVENE